MGDINSGNNGQKQPSKATSKPASVTAHSLSGSDVSRELGADSQDGLTIPGAKSRLEKYGRNELDDGTGVQPFKILVRQVANAMMLVRFPICFPQLRIVILTRLRC